METANKIAETQGAETKRQPSKTVVTKQFGELIKNLDLLGWITKEERSTMEKIKLAAKNKFINEL